MDIRIEKTLLDSAVHILTLKAQTETISIEKEYIWGLIDRINEAIYVSEQAWLLADEGKLTYE